jgi:glycosyltransferase involved in cell wall biosynthesis
MRVSASIAGHTDAQYFSCRAAMTTSERLPDSIFGDLRPGQELGLGYVLTRVSTGNFVELTLSKGERSFRVWLRSASDNTPCYRQAGAVKIGYEGELPDRDALRLLNALCELAGRDAAKILESAHQAVLPDDAAMLGSATFSSIHEDWLSERERQLAGRFQRVRMRRERSILVVNATKGLQFYPSIVDFFALLQRVRPGVSATGASYFAVREFQEGVGAKGLAVATIAEVMAWSAAQLNRFDVVLFVGPSEAMARIIALPDVTVKLVLLDLGFYHQLIEINPDAFLKRENVTWRRLRWHTARLRKRSSQVNPVVAYSCQPEDKIALDLANGGCALRRVEWRWFNYIPIGFTYCTDKYYRTSTRAFDVALLAAGGRDYAQIDPALFRGKRFLFLGSIEEAPEVGRLRGQLDIAVVSRVNEDTYARLLALCRCVVLPLRQPALNVYLSVVDAVAAGKPLVIPRHDGLARLERDNVPAVFYDGTPAHLFRQVDGLLRDDGRRQVIEARSIAFAKEWMDIYRVLWAICEEQIL